MSTRRIAFVMGYVALVGTTTSSAIGAEVDSALSSYNIATSSSIELTGAHTNNVLKTPAGVKDTTFNLALMSSLTLSKPDQVIMGRLGISSTHHRTRAKEDDDTYNFSVNMSQKASKNWRFDIAAGIVNTVLDRGAFTEEDADHRTKTKTKNSSISGIFETERYQYSLALLHSKFDLKDNTKQGITLNKDDEDRSETDIVMRGVFKSSGGFQPSFTVSYGQIYYDETLDDYGQNRSSVVTKFLLGGAYKVGHHASINGDIGYYWRNYDGVSFDSIKVAIGNMMFNVKVSENLTGFAGASRSFNELNVANSPGLIIDDYSVGLIYRPTEALSLKGSTGKIHSEAQLLGIVAIDHINSISGSYVFSQDYSASLQYVHTKRTTNSPIYLPYTESTIALKFTATF